MNCSQIITTALRRLGILAAGQQPDESQIEDHLETLKALYLRWVNDGTFGRLCDIIPLADTEHLASPMTRIAALDPTTVILPETIRCGGREATAVDGSVIVVVHRTTRQTATYIYDSASHDWRQIDHLQPTDFAPLAYRDPIGLACYLAIELSEEYGQEISELTVRNAMAFRTSLTHDYSRGDNSPVPYY
ncbi:hypothetical protein OKW76_06985 [Sphingomonas sp. S1-29]|uniref:hypothetical protein n=1 Tax=Sphingomonas sp. S1-29 TaxID=2991074 RepID=UPI00223E9589|nr:hypothetical protein [Sphingomonas sp. S1-29]UZK70759.1 hypothetical protein OKW76_06985 [Sphingomonas sp. S1-29]